VTHLAHRLRRVTFVLCRHGFGEKHCDGHHSVLTQC